MPRTEHERALIDFTPGAFAPACGDYDVLRSNRGVYLTAITRRGQVVWMYDVLRSWLHNDNRRSIVAAAADRSDTVCPEE